MVKKLYKGDAETIRLLHMMTASSPANGESFDVETANGYPSGDDYFVIILNDEGPREEKMLVKRASATSSTFVLHGTLGRGFDDTSPTTHPPGEHIDHVLDADSLTDMNAHIYDPTRDDHPQYIQTDGGNIADVTDVAVSIGSTNTTGSGTKYSRYNHVHKIGNGIINDLVYFSTPTLPVYVGTSLPTSPAVGQRAVRTDQQKEYIYSDAATPGWTEVGSYYSWDTYTPTWTATGSPAIGNGTLIGRYRLMGKTCFLRVYFLAGTTTTYGTGAWSISLPNVVSGHPTGSQTGRTFAVNGNGLVQHTGTVYLPPGGTALQLFSNASPATTWQANVPFTWATGFNYAVTINFEVF